MQRSLPITLVGAGLPQIPRLAGEAKSYAERLFTFPELGRLDELSAGQAIAGPAQQLGVDFHPDALRLVVAETEGYPFFLQEFGRVLWNHTPASPITAANVHAAQPAVEHELDASFFRVRAGRTTDLELRYLRPWPNSALAATGPAPSPACWAAPPTNSARSATRLIDERTPLHPLLRARRLHRPPVRPVHATHPPTPPGDPPNLTAPSAPTPVIGISKRWQQQRG